MLLPAFVKKIKLIKLLKLLQKTSFIPGGGQVGQPLPLPCVHLQYVGPGVARGGGVGAAGDEDEAGGDLHGAVVAGGEGEGRAGDECVDGGVEDLGKLVPVRRGDFSHNDAKPTAAAPPRTTTLRF